MTDADAAIERTIGELVADAGDDPAKTRHVDCGHEVLARVPAWLAAHHADLADVVICDPHTHAAAGDRLAAALRAAGRRVTVRVIEPQHGEEHVVCDDAVIEALQEELAPQAGTNAIAVGAGTINDIVKMAVTRLGRPYQCVATAASMNGYTSAIAAVLSRGVKRTLPTRQAEAVFADIDIVAAAPAYLNQAGFGDLLSKPYSHADWLLSHLVRGVDYEERPARLLDDAYDALLDRAADVGAATREGIGLLTRTILLSGFTMAIAGTSAPASGGEHLVSHYWDMEQHCRNLPLFGLHGTQVGVATRLSAILFERLVALPKSAIDPEAAAARRPDARWLDDLPSMHPRLTPDVIAEVRDQIVAKQRHGAALRDEIAHVHANWDEIARTMKDVLVPHARIASALKAAGAADRCSAMGVEADHGVATLRVCRQIRNRYVALDLLDDLGVLEGAAAEAVAITEQS
jgi:glycerol-1-phosphate dehydrogenase [NAD(P)+]